jgi:hypothetical protein
LHGVPSDENRERNRQRWHRRFTRKYHTSNTGGAVSSPRERERNSSRGRLSEPQTKTEMARKIKTRRHAARGKASEERQRGGRKSLRRRTRDKVSRRLPCPGAAPRTRDRRRAGKRKTKRRNRRHELSNRGLSSLGTEVDERKRSSSKTSGKNTTTRTRNNGGGALRE